MSKYVYFFGRGKADGNVQLKNLLGGKGSNLAEMTNLGIPVPPGFTITTEVCTYYYTHNRTYPPGLQEEVARNLTKLERVIGTKFGHKDNPLLVSVRSGARVSMPGMMDTVLNIGLSDETVKGLAKKSGNPRFSYDCYRRLIQMYGNVVSGVRHEKFEEVLERKKKAKGVRADIELDGDALRELIEDYKKIVEGFPQDPMGQLWGAISSVLESWNAKRAVEYRRLNDIPDDWGTAVNVQAMIYGNMGETSATGVAFTRNPATGENIFYGEWLRNAQGEDVVAGIRTPCPINIVQKGKSELPSLQEEMPEIYAQLLSIRDRLERHFRDIQDIEFTIEQGRLFILQTRAGKRTPLAAAKVAVDMVKEGLISKEKAIRRVSPEVIETLLHPMIDTEAEFSVCATGLPASPGVATGQVVFSPEDAVEARPKSTILVRLETSPEDIAGMAVCEGIFTQRGGMTSHAAVVARGMGKPCVVGCESIFINYEKEEFRVGSKVVKKGDTITIDGTTGNLILGDVPKTRPSGTAEFRVLLGYADKIRRLGVMANADTPEAARTARELGAEGIGLTRTEHMFFGKDRIKAVREMILADKQADRIKALSKLLPMQKEDFKGIFREMDGLPVIIRMLDPPLHEFIPHEKEKMRELAREMGVPEEVIEAKVRSLSEVNPMLGHRGCRLGISYPEITQMQARAIFEAACEVGKEGIEAIPEVMVPVLSEVKEFENQRSVIDRVAKEVMDEYDVKLDYKVGTMIEIPRAALTADEIAKSADFFSFGTNDLTQTTFGFSRDDIGKILPDYIAKGILKYDPFQRIDEQGVGDLIKMGIERGRKTRPDLEIGICGEHGGDPHSVIFCHRVGMDYVSCSPYRVPIARLVAAQAKLQD